ncbi:MAG: amidohydrolase [Deinococcales bacterium]
MAYQADMIIVNAKAYTLDERQPYAEAVAIKGNRIIFVGAEREALGLKNPQTRLIDAQKQSLMPGIIDSHFHLLWGSLRLKDIDLVGTRDLSELKRRILAYREKNPALDWLRGQGLGYMVAPPGQRLNRHHLDEIVRDKPLVLTCFDFHTAWCNTLAMEMAGLMQGTGPLVNGQVVMQDGLATGELREPDAMNLVYDLIPKATRQQSLEMLKQGMAQAAAYGITSVHNMDGSFEQYSLYQQLESEGALSLRMYMPYSINPDTPLSAVFEEAVALRESYSSGKLRSGAVKFFMDGVVESFTAFMLEPYTNRPQDLGEAIYSDEHFKSMALEADKHGLQIFVHAIGDAAIRRTLDGYAYIREKNGPRDSRHRIEHIEVIHPEDIPRLKALEVIASMQPFHCTRPELGYLTSWMDYIGKAGLLVAFLGRA